jgi:hypothetical protein
MASVEGSPAVGIEADGLQDVVAVVADPGQGEQSEMGVIAAPAT